MRFESSLAKKRMSLTKLIRYPQTPPGQFGVNAHHDTWFLDLVGAGSRGWSTSSKSKKGDWISVPLVAHALVSKFGRKPDKHDGPLLLCRHTRIASRLRRSALCLWLLSRPLPVHALVLLLNLTSPTETLSKRVCITSQAGVMTQTQQPRDRMEDDGGDRWTVRTLSRRRLQTTHVGRSGLELSFSELPRTHGDALSRRHVMDTS
jgi:hypothetical protein